MKKFIVTLRRHDGRIIGLEFSCFADAHRVGRGLLTESTVKSISIARYHRIDSPGHWWSKGREVAIRTPFHKLKA